MARGKVESDLAMRLDTGSISDTDIGAAHGVVANEAVPTLHSGPDLGRALKAIRESRGLTITDLAETTRVRAAYLKALEEMRLDQLPSRPFTIGYVRAYAAALGLDAEAAVERFKSDDPVLDEPLRAPLGVREDRDPRLLAIFVAACVIVAAIVAWNIAQRAMSEAAPPPPKASETAALHALDAVKAGPVSLGAPLPAPVESTTPPPYETPGLADADAEGVNHSPPAQLGVRDADATPVDVASLPRAFTPKGKIYGAPAADPSVVTLQALKSASLIVRGADGSVYFARQLAVGEAYRAPQLGGLALEVSDPDAFQVFVGGQSKGVMPNARSALGALQGG